MRDGEQESPDPLFAAVAMAASPPDRRTTVAVFLNAAPRSHGGRSLGEDRCAERGLHNHPQRSHFAMCIKTAPRLTGCHQPALRYGGCHSVDAALCGKGGPYARLLSRCARSGSVLFPMNFYQSLPATSRSTAKCWLPMTIAINLAKGLLWLNCVTSRSARLQLADSPPAR